MSQVIPGEGLLDSAIDLDAAVTKAPFEFEYVLY